MKSVAGKALLVLICLGMLPLRSQAQTSIVDPADSLDKNRLIAVTTTMGAAYIGSMVGLNYLWYKDYPRSSFQFFNDNKEWNQMDKAGHMQTAYFQSLWSMKALEWSGVEKKKAAWYGAAMGFVFQSTIEVLDGFSEKWGASPGDIAANAAGSLTMVSQELLWGEQRISLKYSMHSYNYPSGIAEERARALYGNSFIERMLKDYNGQAYWMSFNTASFFRGQKRMKWLNVALGYGSGGMYGGFQNSWIDNDGNTVVFPEERYRQFFLSLDADLTKIPVKRKGFKPLLYILNVFKMPAPAIEINTKGQILFHPVYFMNINLPITIKN